MCNFLMSIIFVTSAKKVTASFPFVFAFLSAVKNALADLSGILHKTISGSKEIVISV